MTSLSAGDIKKALVGAGLEVYRTRGPEVVVADRVRDNLIMDSGISLEVVEGAIRIRFVVRAQRSDFPSEPTSTLFDRARRLAAVAAGRGFAEASASKSRMTDPADPAHTLDVWYEVAFEKVVPCLDDAVAEVRFALALEKAVPGARVT